jgi:environmental stress-induced protein Ves
MAGANDLPCTTSFTVIRAAELVASPWKNGGGVTREIAAYPPQAGLDTFVWRVSVADVERDGPFSRFEGIDRTLALLGGAGMTLAADDGHAWQLDAPLMLARFPGEAAIDARLAHGPTRDFNLMVRRASASGKVDVWRGSGEHRIEGDVCLVFGATGEVEVTLAEAPPIALAAMDTVRIETRPAQGALHVRTSGNGAAIAVAIRYVDKHS